MNRPMNRLIDTQTVEYQLSIIINLLKECIIEIKRGTKSERNNN